jgi:hypothetical protein
VLVLELDGGPDRQHHREQAVRHARVHASEAAPQAVDDAHGCTLAQPVRPGIRRWDDIGYIPGMTIA